MKKFGLLVVLLVCSACARSGYGVFGASSGGDRPKVLPASWTVGAWYIDPANALTCASDNNNCTQSTCGAAGSFQGPCVSYAEIAARWGTYSPRLRQNTVLTWLSSQTGDTDPVYFTPYVENQAYAEIAGTPTTILTGSLASVTAQNRATPQLWQASLTGTGSGPLAAGELLVDTTAAAEMWTYALVTGTTWSLSEPLSPATTTAVGQWPGRLAAQKAISNGDAFVLETLPTVNIVDVEPTEEEWNTTSFAGGVFLYNVAIYSPATGATQPLTLGAPVVVASSSTARVVGGGPHPHSTSNAAFSNQAYSQELYNVYSTAGILNVGAPTDATQSFDGSFIIAGGIVTGGDIVRLGSVSLAQDVILASAAHGIISMNHGRVSQAYVASGQVIQTSGLVSVVTDNIGNGPQMWGPGMLQIWGGSAVSYKPTATATFLQTGGFTIDGQTTACSYTNVAPSTVACGITVNVTNLDTATGLTAFGGTAFVPGGGSLRAFNNIVP